LAETRGPTRGQYGWMVCANVNAKNAFGGYVGPRGMHIVVRGDQLYTMAPGP
jgi:hypothetical protein